jgi:cbb3-type cytochrome oxidase subunit 3
MAAEAIFFTIMFIVFVGYVVVMHNIKRNEANRT